MTLISYPDFVRALAKPGEAIRAELTATQAHLLHMAVGVAGESGELLDAVKKHVVYQKDIDRENVVEELGDLKFYITGLMNELDITDEEVEAHNRTKLSARFAKLTYSNEAAQARADKQ